VLIGFKFFVFVLHLKTESGIQQSGVLLIILCIPIVSEEQLRINTQGLRNFEETDSELDGVFAAGIKNSR
jgi:hypothetical protein